MNFKPNFKNKSKQGFTLIEIVIVVAIISILTVLAAASFLNARINANEVAAISGCRIINNACQAYYMHDNPHTYPNSLLDLARPVMNPPYIDEVLASGSKEGYDFRYSLVDSETYTLNANPTRPGRTGRRYFFVNETGIIRTNPNGQAGRNDPPVE